MSIEHCDKCDANIDTDTNAEHFNEDCIVDTLEQCSICGGGVDLNNTADHACD